MIDERSYEQESEASQQARARGERLELVVPPNPLPGVREALERVGCTFKDNDEESLLLLPVGSINIRMLPGGSNSRSRIILPCGEVLYEQWNRFLGRDGQSLLSIPRHLLELGNAPKASSHAVAVE